MYDETPLASIIHECVSQMHPVQQEQWCDVHAHAHVLGTNVYVEPLVEQGHLAKRSASLHATQYQVRLRNKAIV
jgi:hypothetical protein